MPQIICIIVVLKVLKLLLLVKSIIRSEGNVETREEPRSPVASMSMAFLKHYIRCKILNMVCLTL